jgi:hypothetical protein
MSGDLDGARGVAGTIRTGLGSSEDVQRFWSFMDERLGTAPAY